MLVEVINTSWLQNKSIAFPLGFLQYGNPTYMILLYKHILIYFYNDIKLIDLLVGKSSFLLTIQHNV